MRAMLPRLGLSFFALGLLVAVSGSVARAASADGNVEWGGVSHLDFQDRRPLCPLGGESFDVLVRAWRDDLTGVRVGYDVGAGLAYASATLDGTLGPYDLWRASVPATGSTQVRYYFELSDGADVDFYSPGGMQDGAPNVADGFLIDFATLIHAPVGATPHPTQGVVFKVWSPTTTSAHVRGNFNNWGTTDPMTRVGEYWVAQVSNATLNQRYKYFFDNAVWNSDPRGRAIDGGDNYNALVQDVLNFPWASEGFQTPPLEEMVIYQLHVGTFAGYNDPAGSTFFPSRYVDVADRVSHLVDLGVNAVLLNPITEFPGDYSAGYNPVTNWAAERKYGAPNDLKRLVDALHGAGIAVLLDIVWNHQSPTDNFLWDYDGNQIYFDSPQVDTPWGAQCDFDAAEVRDMYVHSAHMWLDEFRFDGFRMDATSYMAISPQGAAGWALMQRLNDEVDNRWADRVVIAEQLPDDAAYTRATGAGGAGFDAQYFDAFTDRLREEIQDAAFGDPEMWKIRDVINGYGTELSQTRVVNYVELHDEAWPESGGQRLVQTIDPSVPHDDQWAKGRTKLAQGITLLSPGVPAMLMGTEWLEDRNFGTDQVNRLDWSKKSTYAGIFDYYQALVGLRTTRPELRSDAFHQVYHLNENANVLGMRRGLGDGSLLVLANFSNSDYTGYRVGVPYAADWEVLVDSQDAAYEGSGSSHPAVIASETITRDGFAESIVLDLPAMALVVLQEHAPTAAPVEGARSAFFLSPGSPNPALAHSRLELRLPRAQRVQVTLHDVRGRTVRTVLDARRDAGTHVLDVPTRELARGTYFVRVRTQDGDLTRKLTVIR